MLLWQMQWRVNGSNKCIVRAYYKILISQADAHFLWKTIWRSRVPSKVTFFVWTAALGKILTSDNLRKRGCIVMDWCYLCKKNGESVDHLLLYCEVTRMLWDEIFRRIDVAWVMPLRVVDLLACWKEIQGCPQVAVVWKMIPLCIMWCIWSERNERCFEDRERTMAELHNFFVCAAFVQLIEVRPSFLEPHLSNIIEYMLQVNKDTDDEVALEACEFWSAYCDAQLPLGNLREFLPRLVPVLLSNMVYADDDESIVDAEEDGSLPDRDQDLKPRFHSSRFHGSDNAEDDDDDIVNVWNLRKCSAAALDILSNVFGDEILPTLMPIVQVNLSNTDDTAWKDREAAVLALGAIAEGCIHGLYPHLSEIVTFLIPLLDDKFPLIRSISCWTLSRFSKFIVQGIGHQKGYEQFDKVLMGLLRRILDPNKRVQEAACSAFATLEEEAAEELAPRLEIILQHLMCAFGKYQRRNLRIVYDAIGTLADAVGEELNQSKYLDILMPPLIAKWQQLSNSDKDIFPLLECFTSVAQALGNGFSQFAEPVFQRCISIIQTQELAKVDSVSAGVQYDKEFVVCCLDLLSGLAEGLGSGIESLVSHSNLRELLLQCCMDYASDVRQSAFALLGDLAKVCPVHLQPRLSEFLDVAVKQLSTPNLKDTLSVANNACWAIGELAVKVRQEITPVVLTVISCLVPILQHAEELNKSLIENSAITLGRVAWVCPELVAPHMEHFMEPWCSALSMIRDDVEKVEAFRGLCAMVKVNPSGALGSLVFMCKAIASWHEIRSEDLHNDVSQVLHGYKQMLINGVWDQCMSALEPPVKDKLSKYLV